MRKISTAMVFATVFVTIAVLPGPFAQATETADCASIGAIVGTDLKDALVGTSHDDILCGGAGDDIITTGGGTDTVYGGTGIDYVDGQPEDCVNPAPGTILGTSAGETLSGTAGPDIICGFGGNDVINGLGGNDIIYSGDGNDTVDAGFGDDYIDFGAGNDTGFGGPGGDRLFGGNGEDALAADVGVDGIDGGAGNDTISGNDGADHLSGGSGNDTIVGGAGSDSMVGGDGTDTFDGGGGVDYCVNTTGETLSSCFYDNAAPTVTSVSVDTPTVTVVSRTDQVSALLRVTVSDLGVGVTPNAQNISPNGISIFFGSLPSLGGTVAMSGRNCQLAEGDAWLGTWVCPVRIPTEIFSTTVGKPWGVGVTDGVGNHSVAAQKGTAFTIVNNWTGSIERTKPTVSNLTFDSAQRTFDTSDGRRYMVGTVTAADNVGVYKLEFGLDDFANYQSGNLGYAAFILDNAPACADGFNSVKTTVISQISVDYTDQPSYRADIPDLVSRINYGGSFSGNAFAVCRTSGDESSGTYRFIYVLPQFPAKPNLQMNIRAMDFSGNYSTNDLGTDITISNSRMDFSDTTSPILNSIAVTPVAINTATSSQMITIRVNVRDSGNGFNEGALVLQRKSTSTKPQPAITASINYGTCISAGGLRSAPTPVPSDRTVIAATSCMISGDQNNAVFEVKVLLPAHFPNGKFVLHDFMATDLIKWNATGWQAKTIKNHGLAVFVTNG